MITVYSSGSSVLLELRFTSAPIKSTIFFVFLCICTVLNTLEDDFFFLFLTQNKHRLLQYRRNDFFLLERYYLKKVY